MGLIMAFILLITPLISPVAIILGIVFCCTKKLRQEGKVIIAVASGALLLCIFVYSVIIICFSDGSPYVSDAVYIVPVFVAPAVAFVTIILGLFAWRKKAGKIFFALFLAVTVAVIAVPLGIYIRNDRIPVISEGTTYEDYDPYENGSKIVVPGDASFEFSDDQPFPKLDGATALFPVYSAFFRAVYPADIFSSDENMKHEYLALSTTTGAYKKIVDGDVDMIFVASASEEQKAYAAEKGVELEFIPLGSEAFVFFVNAENPIDDITVSDVRRIYTGEVTKWSELGVDGLGDIIAFQRDAGSGSQTALEKLIGKDDLITPPGREVVMGMGGMLYKVADYKNFKNAIGYSFRYYTTVMNENSGLKVLSLNGIEPTAENIGNGTYPVSVNFYAVIRSDADENTRAFIDWMLSPEGQAIIEKTGYVPLAN